MKTEPKRLDLSDRVAMNAKMSCHANVVFPSPLPSPTGRGRHVHCARRAPPSSLVRMLPGLSDKKAVTGDDTTTLLLSTACCPLSPRERVRVRGNHAIATLLISARALPQDQRADEPVKPKINVCFVLDTTGSMSGLIEGAKQKIWSIANEVIAAKPTPAVKFSLVAYRD